MCVQKKIVIERTRDLIYLKFVATDFSLKIISPYIIADMAIPPSECLQGFYFRLVAVHGYMQVRFAVSGLKCSENNCVDRGVRMQTVGNLKVHFQ